MKWMLLIFVVLVIQSCLLSEEEPEILLSTIDGAEYYEVIKGSMNTQKAVLLILEGNEDSVDYEIKLDLVDSIELQDSLWTSRYLNALNKILKEVYHGDPDYVESKLFSFFIHFPNKLIHHLNNDGFNEIDTWMLILNRGLKLAIEPDDITINSVANATISNCKGCNKKQQELIVNFISKLNTYE